MWINDGNFIGIGNERDPIIGQQEETRDLPYPRIQSEDSCAALKDSTCFEEAYFFTPSLSAIELTRKVVLARRRSIASADYAARLRPEPNDQVASRGQYRNAVASGEPRVISCCTLPKAHPTLTAFRY